MRSRYSSRKWLNPTSAGAVIAQSQTLISLAGQLNTGNGDGLYQIAQMAQAIELGTTPDALPDECRGVMAHFRNPAMPTVAETTDAATKIAAVRPEFASTDTFLEMVGFDQADIRRIKAQEQRVRGQQLLNSLAEEEGTAGSASAAEGNPPMDAGPAAGQVTS